MTQSVPSNIGHAVVVGLGKSGLSAVRYLKARGYDVAVTDSRAEPPQLAQLRELDAALAVHTGGFDPALLDGASLLVLSPGVAPRGPFFDAARARGLPMVGDVELFARAVTAPVVAITGTNGKSTVTTLVARFATRAGLRVRAGGNLGDPALDLLAADVELYVLELSSFQLESTESLELLAAAVLNVTPDHMDRYADLAAYAAAKARILAHCQTAVIALDDPLVAAMARSGQKRLTFSLRADAGADYSVGRGGDGAPWLMRGSEPLLALSAMKLSGLHNAANALAALALGEALALPRAAMLEELRQFPGLAHRAQWVADIKGVRYINDSKGTNVGATVAAVQGLTAPVILIAGGDGKGQDFSALRAGVAGKVRAAVLIGRDAALLATALRDVCPCHLCATLEAAVVLAASLARPGDVVLLSPACASLDMFRDYTHRGAVFADAVARLAA